MKLPEPLYFLRAGWWALHVAAVGAVFAAGFVVSGHLADHASHTTHAAHAEHTKAHHDHTSPQVLRPLMKQLLVDSVQLQGALSRGELTRAATHADAIAGACEDSDSAHGAAPERLGKSFVEHDRALHRDARQLSDALRAGRRDEARALSRAVVSTCQSCHAQAPAAKGVDLHVLTSFANTLAASTGGAP